MSMPPNNPPGPEGPLPYSANPPPGPGVPPPGPGVPPPGPGMAPGTPPGTYPDPMNPGRPGFTVEPAKKATTSGWQDLFAACSCCADLFGMFLIAVVLSTVGAVSLIRKRRAAGAPRS